VSNRKEDPVTKTKTNVDNNSKQLAEGLTGLLADTYTLYNTTQFYHWNVEGPQFHTLHLLFEEQYGDLADAVDLIAERIRVLGWYTPGTLADFLKLSRIQQKPNVRKTDDMLSHLIEGHRQVSHRIRELLGETEKVLDQASEDMLIERLRVHEKTTWMLSSQAGRDSRSMSLENREEEPAMATV